MNFSELFTISCLFTFDITSVKQYFPCGNSFWWSCHNYLASGLVFECKKLNVDDDDDDGEEGKC